MCLTAPKPHRGPCLWGHQITIVGPIFASGYQTPPSLSHAHPLGRIPNLRILPTSTERAPRSQRRQNCIELYRRVSCDVSRAAASRHSRHLKPDEARSRSACTTCGLGGWDFGQFSGVSLFLSVLCGTGPQRQLALGRHFAAGEVSHRPLHGVAVGLIGQRVHVNLCLG